MSPRPKSENPRSATLSIRLTPEEKLEVGKRAKAAKMLTGEYLRAAALGGFAGTPEPTAVIVAPIAGQVTVEEVLEADDIGFEPGVVDTWTEPPAVDPAVAIEVAAEVAEAQLADVESREAFIDRRTLQLHGQGATKPVARMKAAQEWEAR